MPSGQRYEDPSSPLATRLTQRQKREAKAANHARRPAPSPHSICQGCGKVVASGSANCAVCAVGVSRQRMSDVARLGRAASKTPERPSAGIRNPASPSSRAVWLVAIEPTRLAYGKGLYRKDQASLGACVNFGNSQSARRVVSLRGGNPCGPTPTASEALAGAIGTGWRHKPMSAPHLRAHPRKERENGAADAVRMVQD